MRAGRKGQRLMLQSPLDQFPVTHLRLEKHWIVPVVRPAAAGVSEQVVHGDVRDGAWMVFCKIELQPSRLAEDEVVEPNPALFNEAENGGRRDRFADAGDAEEMRGGDVHAGLLVGVTESLNMHEFPAPGDGHREAGHSETFHELPGNEVDPGSLGIACFRERSIVLSRGSGRALSERKGAPERGQSESLDAASTGEHFHDLIATQPRSRPPPV